MSKNMQIVLSEDEYQRLQVMAEKKGISVSKYVRDLIFGEEDNFSAKWNLLLKKLEEYPEGSEFNVSNVLGFEEWNKLDRSTKLSLAKTLNRHVDSGNMSNIIKVGRSSSNVTLYKKIKE